MPAVARLEVIDVDAYGNIANERANADPSPHFANDAHVHHLTGGRAMGLHDPAETYFAMDVCAFNGSEWRAVRDNPGPLPGDGWRLGARGSRGKPGERGRDGVHVKKMSLIGYTVTIELSDGSRLHCSLLPALQLFERERGK